MECREPERPRRVERADGDVDARRVDALVDVGSRGGPPVPGAEEDGIPSSGMAALRLPSIGVLIDYRTLVVGLHADSICEYSSGEPLAVSTARRLACDADVYPAVLGSARTVLDLGCSHRLANRAQRRALGIRDKGCVEPGCTAPIEWCEAHHVIDWYGPRRGPTDLDNLVLLCRHHHGLLHRGLWALPPEVVERAERCLARHRRRATSADQRRETQRGAPP